MIKYTLPGLTEFPDILLLFVQMKNNMPHYFFDDVCIDSIYGGFPGSKCCGGRPNLGNQLSSAQIRSIVGKYNKLGVACNVTFTNQCIRADDLAKSEYDRAILDALSEDSRNGVILYSDEIAQFVKEHYPQLKRIASTTKEHENLALHEADLTLYDRSVLNYNLTHDTAALAEIKTPQKFEIMANEYCTLNCPYRKKHYRAISEAQAENRMCEFTCIHDPAPQAYGFLQGLLDGDVFLTNKQIRHINEQYGVEQFKIVGRGLATYDLVDALLYYLIQPDSWYEIRDFLIRHDYLL